MLGLIVMAFLPHANRPGVSPAVNESRRQTGNVVGAVLSVVGLLGIAVPAIGRAAGAW